MTPFADHFFMSMLQHTWEQAQLEGLTAWRRIFPRALSTEFADESWAALAQRGLTFRSAYAPTIDTPEAAAVISVALMPEEQELEFFANAHGQMDPTLGEADNDRWTTLNQATLHVFVYASPKDVVRALHQFVLASLYSNQEWLLQAGFEQFWYRGATDLVPDKKLAPFNTDIYGRVVRLQFSGQTDIGRIIGDNGVTPSWITVADERVQVDKFVNPTTGEEHDLTATVAGGMMPRPHDE
jgi:hypothetical protein